MTVEAKTSSVIIGSGCYLPPQRITNEHFLNNQFFDAEGKEIETDNRKIISKFEEITTIRERRYVNPDQVTSEIATYAAEEALKNSGIDPEELDYIIAAHNFGDVGSQEGRSDMVPCIAARVKHNLSINNPECVAYDVIFGCPGWLQGIIQADFYIRSGQAKKILVIGAEVLSRVCDPHDRDSMLYADGAGAVVLEAQQNEKSKGILATRSRSDSLDYSGMLQMDKSYNAASATKDAIFLKMNGRKLYQYALETVPQAIKECIDRSGVDISRISKLLIHQANGKMDEAILQRMYKLYEISVPDRIMPMTIDWLGNSSVATLPTLYHLLLEGKINGYQLGNDEAIVFASVGAGMNINAVVYHT